MELDRIERDEQQRLPNTRKIMKPAMATTPTTNETGHERTTSEPIPLEMQEKARDHDSLVTVRLSEPPSLTVNTAVPPSTIPPRYDAEYAPSKTMAETLNEEDDDDDDSESEIFEPDTRKKKGPSLQDELGEAEEGRSDDVANDSRSSSGSDAVDWDKLQATEDMEARNKQNAQAVGAKPNHKESKETSDLHRATRIKFSRVFGLSHRPTPSYCHITATFLFALFCSRLTQDFLSTVHRLAACSAGTRKQQNRNQSEEHQGQDH